MVNSYTFQFLRQGLALTSGKFSAWFRFTNFNVCGREWQLDARDILHVLELQFLISGTGAGSVIREILCMF